MIEIVNIVASGYLGTELDLEKVAMDIGSNGKYNPDKYPGMYFSFEEDSPLITLYRTGKYIVTGAKTEQMAYSTRDEFLELLSNKGMIEDKKDEWFRIQNLVCTAELDHSLDLNRVAIDLGLENTEYEPEQFPGLIYRSQDSDAVTLLFSSGRVVITGSAEINTVRKTFELLKKSVDI